MCMLCCKDVQATFDSLWVGYVNFRCPSVDQCPNGV
jgi:hypothetical protein